jgi:H2-forming N5,N10-methylenetetrahydromethanopterin dehydrogenase-like enzyme
LLFLPSVKFIERHAFVIYEECPNAVEAMCGESERMDVGASSVHPEGPPMTTERDEKYEEGRDES